MWRLLQGGFAGGERYRGTSAYAGKGRLTDKEQSEGQWMKNYGGNEARGDSPHRLTRIRAESSQEGKKRRMRTSNLIGQ